MMEAAKEKILNIFASANAGMDKTMAVGEEKAEKVKTNDPLQKKRVEDRKQEKIHQAELEKQQAYQQNAIRKGDAQHAEAGHQTSLGGHHTGVEQQTSLNEPTGGLTGLHRTDPPTIGTKTNPTGHETSVL